MIKAPYLILIKISAMFNGYSMLCCVMLCYAVLCCALLCFAVLCYTMT